MTNTISSEQLKQYITKIERLEDDKSDISEEIKQVFDQAKANGFDVKIMKEVLKLKKCDKNDLAEKEAILELYRNALGI